MTMSLNPKVGKLGYAVSVLIIMGVVFVVAYQWFQLAAVVDDVKRGMDQTSERMANFRVTTTAVIAADGASWELVSPAAPWSARDSCGEAVFADRMWILGGWFDSYQDTPRDVWSSPDGKNWTRVVEVAPWRHGDLPMTLVYRDRLWLMGGWHDGRRPGHSASHEVWSSGDGLKWDAATLHAGWSARLAAAVVVFQDKMWLLGGVEDYYFGNDDSLKNDVWCSTDGKEWTRVIEHAAWSPRAYHQVVVHDGKLWLLGGGNYVPNYEARNDVWCSEDGVNWSCVRDAAPWPPRIWFSALVYRDHIWVLGGWSNNPSRNWGDVWYSRDGKEWSEHKALRQWKARHEHSAFVMGDKIFVAGGHAEPLSREVWSLELPRDWAGQAAP